jgi:hypothetical protein
MYNALYMVHLKDVFGVLNPNIPKPDSKSLYFRNIERGCILVNVTGIRIIL